MPEIIDQALALQLAGGDQDLADELFAILLRDLPGLGEALNEALNAQRRAELREVAHKLNGATRYCGVPALAQAADALECQVLEGEAADAADGVRRVNREIERLLKTASQR